MKKMFLFLMVAAMIAVPSFAQTAPRVESYATVTAGATFVGDDQNTTVNESRTDGHINFGFYSALGPVSIWTGFGGMAYLNSNYVMEFRYPWLVSNLGFAPLISQDGKSFLKLILSLPWDRMSYVSPGPGVWGQLFLPTTADGKYGVKLQGDFTWYPGVFKNPWYDQAKSAGVTVGENFSEFSWGGSVAFDANGYTVGADVRGTQNEQPGNFSGKLFKNMDMDFGLRFGVPGFSVRAFSHLDKWHGRLSSGSIVLNPTFGIETTVSF